MTEGKIQVTKVAHTLKNIIYTFCGNLSYWLDIDDATEANSFQTRVSRCSLIKFIINIDQIQLEYRKDHTLFLLYFSSEGIKCGLTFFPLSFEVKLSAYTFKSIRFNKQARKCYTVWFVLSTCGVSTFLLKVKT